MRLPALPLAACLLAHDPAPSASSLPAGSNLRLDPRLAAAALPGAEPVAVWVEFADKGEQGPGDLADRLAAAARDLTPECRRRRDRAHVRPLVDYLDLPLEPAYLSGLERLGFALYGQSRWFNRVALRAGGPVLGELAAMPFVRRVAPVERAMARAREPVSELPADPDEAAAQGPGAPAPGAPRASPAALQALYGQTLGQLSRLHVPALHDSGYTGASVTVCMLDDGFNYYRKHEALRSIPVGASATRDFIRGVTSVEDTLVHPSYFRHGTITLSVLAGRAEGSYLAPAFGCSAALARTEDESGEKPIEMVYWAMGAEWADSLGADIISSSLGYNVFPDSAGTDIPYSQLDGHTTIVTRAAEIAAAKGILVVVSAGNDGANPGVGRKIDAPADANGDSVLTVGAVDSLGVYAGFSSRGPTYDWRIKPDLVAQGVQTLGALALGDPSLYARQTGTSVSAPLVAGLAACLMQARPSWPPVWIIQALKRTASNASHPDTLIGWGIPNGLAALAWVPDTSHTHAPPGRLTLGLAGSNPLRTSGPPTRVRISLGTGAASSCYRVRVFDAGGRLVRELASGSIAPGTELDISWRGDDARGRALVPGLYFLALEGAETAGRRDAVRVVVLR